MCCRRITLLYVTRRQSSLDYFLFQINIYVIILINDFGKLIDASSDPAARRRGGIPSDCVVKYYIFFELLIELQLKIHVYSHGKKCLEQKQRIYL